MNNDYILLTILVIGTLLINKEYLLSDFSSTKKEAGEE